MRDVMPSCQRPLWDSWLMFEMSNPMVSGQIVSIFFVSISSHDFGSIHGYEGTYIHTITDVGAYAPEKIQAPSHNASLPMGYFVPKWSCGSSVTKPT